MKRVLLLACLLAGLLIIPATASATLRLNGCTLAAYKATFSYAYGGLFYARYPVSVSCYQPHVVDIEYQLQQQFGSNWVPVRGSSASSGSWYVSNATLEFDGGFCCVGVAAFRTAIYRYSVDGASAGAVAIDSLGPYSNPSWP